MKTALLAGTTGLIGSQLLKLLLESNRYGKVVAISRRALEIKDPKLQNVIADVDSLEGFKPALVADDVFCCLGTTMGKARTKDAFRRVDLDYPVLLAKLSREQGARQYFLVSALGANKSSSIFYNQVKGLTEEAITAFHFESYHVFRPSLLMGPRTEARAGEKAAQGVYKFLRFLIPKKYKAIESIKVARAMLAFAGKEQKGNFIHESAGLQRY
jgi:uncharacterized protein YbjT (DUF2867 family)